jgi:hypothetical protein
MLRSVRTRGYVTGNVQDRECFWCADLIFIVERKVVFHMWIGGKKGAALGKV